MRRKKMKKQASRKAFKKSAGTATKNIRARPMRGGWRL